MQYNRGNLSLVGRWWWTVDRPLCFSLLLLSLIGVLSVVASSPPVAERLDYGSYYFINRHLIFLSLTLAVMFIASMFSLSQVQKYALLGFGVALLLMLLLPLIGHENKGAVRWIRFGGLTLQPSEFLKPLFSVVVAWIFSQRYRNPSFPSYPAAIGLFMLVIGLLIIQPDFGMSVVVTCVFALQFFLAGVSVIWIALLVVCALGGAVGAYLSLSHVRERVTRFLDPASGDNYQVEKSLEAFQSGGWLGRGVGEGQVKSFIPDSHTDFVFAVLGEEFGVILCLPIIGLYAFIILRALWRLSRQQNNFVTLAAAGLIGQFALQAMINMGVAVNLFPAKGMTLPFLSYGGSSMVAMGLGMGMLLALTRKQYGEYRAPLNER